jgi:hypothetical protein
MPRDCRRLRNVLRKSEPTGQKAHAATGVGDAHPASGARINICLFCIDIARSFTIKASMNQAKFDALDEYGTSPVFNDAERAALDYVTELTKGQEGQPGDFHPYVAALLRARNLRDRLARRQRASLQHDQHRLNIHSDMLYIVAAPPLNGSSHPKQKAQRSSVSPSRAGQGTGTSSSNTRPTQLKDSLGRSRVSRHCLSTTFD